MDNGHRLHNVVYARLETIAQSEKITRVELGFMSRELLPYVTESQDIDIVNRLLGVLTPVNRRVCIEYFGHFLPWEKEHDKDDVFLRFGKKMLGDKKLSKKMAAIAEWLADEANNVWTWAEDNISVEVKKKDFAGTIVKDIQKALAGDEKSGTDPLTRAEIMSAIFLAGLTIEDMLSACEVREAEINSVELQQAA